MQLQATVNSLAISSYTELATAEQKLPLVTGTVAPVAAPPETLQTSPTSQPVSPSGAGAETEAFTEQRQRVSPNDPDQRGQERSASERLREEQEQKLILELAARDREVRQHEMNHAAAGGKYAGAPSYEFERGPDGRLYAVAGQVSIDTSPIPDDPEATLEKAETIIRAALAVSEPSAQDRAVAAQAAAMAADARAELAQQESQSATEQEERGDADELREQRRSEELRDSVEEQREQSEDRQERLQDFNEQLNDVNKKLAEINQRLVDAGVFQKLFPEGVFLDERI